MQQASSINAYGLGNIEKRCVDNRVGERCLLPRSVPMIISCIQHLPDRYFPVSMEADIIKTIGKINGTVGQCTATVPRGQTITYEMAFTDLSRT
ncbi:hypothetical protein AA106555_0632 [Neokomagataea thailandica NBRC 106555]|uniref:Uncharacterized protein n=1 Tax=Neokomagataea thailandica NBRC 106555 TaxID=1223520 RepID=A0ABQ0QNQ7_9PROT|nr:hypothetical protein AA106555_0632 [Neokomagataea thailandica NBRC 106555]